MSKKLSITVSGAVSLGSYEAGVMYEIIHAIGQHNKNVGIDSDNKILIDVLTGASAGGMTSTILAQKLMFEAGALEGPYNNSLYKVWVEDVDISQLLIERPGDNDSASILSSKYIEQLSNKYLTSRYSSHADVPRVHHPAAAEQVWLGLSLSNLNGVNYGYDVFPNGKFIYRQFQDELTTFVDSGNVADDCFDYWNALRNAAVSCGAFPFAFSAVDVIRHDFEYDSPNLIKPQISPTQSFCYTDGGTFQNEPLGMAKNLVDKIDPTHVDSENRYYLFVSPHEKNPDAISDLNAGNADFMNLTKHLVLAIRSQSAFQDWMKAEEINQHIDLLDSRAKGLLNLFTTSNNSKFIDSLNVVAEGLMPLLFPGSNSNTEIESARKRLMQQYAAEYNSLTSDTKDAWINTILVLETAANLGNRDRMNILGITANDSELAGADYLHLEVFSILNIANTIMMLDEPKHKHF